MNESKEVCVDASLAVKWVVKESYDEEALLLLEKWRMDKVELIAPAFFEVEVDSIIRKKVVSRKTLTESEGDFAFELLRRLPIKILNLPNQRQRAWELAKELDQPTIYDATYLALSFLRGCEFWTADEKLYNSVKNRDGSKENKNVKLIALMAREMGISYIASFDKDFDEIDWLIRIQHKDDFATVSEILNHNLISLSLFLHLRWRHSHNP